MSKGYQISRPSWMSRQDYEKCITTWSHGHTVPIQCFHADYAEDCDGYENLTIDHIVPRHHGGTNDTGNLQPLCAKCNRRKYTNDDPYWKQNFVLDQIPDLDNLRAAHVQGVWNPIADTYQEYFSRPINQINQMSYLYAWIVGAGKTISIPITAMALNCAIRKNVGSAAPRIDRILVLAKSVDLRDQLKSDIENDLLKYKIVGSPLRVYAVTDGDAWANERHMKQYDVVVACIHQLWKRDSGMSANSLQKILSFFPLIVIDERHWADDQCDYIVENATNSLVFTTTGTPIEADGRLLSNLVLVSSWGYDESNLADNGVKYLSAQESEAHRFVKIIEIDNADVMICGEEQKISDELHVDGYAKSFKPAMSVFEEVIMEMVERDNVIFGEIAPHRRHIAHEAIPDLSYPAHAVITVDNIKAADSLTIEINKFLDADRRKYPAKLGWNAVVFHSEVEKPEKDKTALDTWRKCYKQNGNLDDKCARIIVAVDKIREGINNPYCCIAGVAKSVGSMVEVVQGPIGRLIRAVTEKTAYGLRVPPEILDRVRIITHRAYRNEDVFAAGIKFIMDMNDYYKGLTQLEDLIAGEEYTPIDGDRSPVDNLTDDDRTRLVVETGRMIDYVAGPDYDGDIYPLNLDPVRIVSNALGRNLSDNKMIRAIEFTNDAISNPAEAYRRLFEPRMAPIAVVIDEHLKDDKFTDEQLMNFIRREELMEYADKLNDPLVRPLILRLFRAERAKFKVREPAKTSKLSEIRNAIGSEIKHNKSLSYEGDKNKPYQFAGRAMKEILGLPQDAKMTDDGDFDIPQVHYILMNQHVRKCIRQLVITDLIRDGQLPHLRHILREQVTHEATQDF